MRRVKFKGYWGNPLDHAENEAMGLVPGEIYEVVKTEPCCDVNEDPSSDCTISLPFVKTKHGGVTLLVHDEFEEFEEIDEIERCTCDFNSVILITGCVCGGK